MFIQVYNIALALLLFLIVELSLHYHFSVIWRTSFSNYFSIDLLVTNSLFATIYYLYFHLHLFLKHSIAQFRSVLTVFFPFSALKILCHFLLASIISEELSIVIQIAVSLQVMCCFAWATFKRFSSSLFFISLWCI